MTFVTYIISAITVFICSILWRWGGDGFKIARNPGVPIALGVTKLIILCMLGWSYNNLIVLLYIPALWAMIQGFSYGLNAPPHKFWVKIFGKGDDGNYIPVEIATRATCGFIWCLPATIFALVIGDLLSFIAYIILATISIGLIGGLNKNAEYSERMTGFFVALSLLI